MYKLECSFYENLGVLRSLVTLNWIRRWRESEIDGGRRMHHATPKCINQSTEFQGTFFNLPSPYFEYRKKMEISEPPPVFTFVCSLSDSLPIPSRGVSRKSSFIRREIVFKKGKRRRTERALTGQKNVWSRFELILWFFFSLYIQIQGEIYQSWLLGSKLYFYLVHRSTSQNIILILFRVGLQFKFYRSQPLGHPDFRPVSIPMKQKRLLTHCASRKYADFCRR